MEPQTVELAVWEPHQLRPENHPALWVLGIAATVPSFLDSDPSPTWPACPQETDLANASCLCRLGFSYPQPLSMNLHFLLPGVLGSSWLFSTCLSCLTISWGPSSLVSSLPFASIMLALPSLPLFSSCSILSLESRFPGSPPYLHQPSTISLLKTIAHIVPCKAALGSYVFYLLPWFQYVSLVLPADSYD